MNPTVDPAEILSVNRIMVIGHPGAGKSTFAKELNLILGLPIIHLDREYWQPGWVELNDHDWRERVTAIANQERWIMDGSYDRTLPIRLPRADVVFLLDYPRWICMQRVIKRICTNLGKVRPDMCDGCPEKIDFVFLKFVWNYHRDRMPMVEQKLAEYLTDGKLVRLANPDSAAHFLRELRII